nr:uncharacterized protein LOC113830039 [Penaeus vannamei]
MRCAGDGENGIRRILMMVILAMVTVSYADAGKQKCKFNGEKFKMGKEVLNLPDHCCSLMCASGGGKGGKPKHSGGILTLEFTPLASCTCQSPSRSVLDLKTVLNRSQLKRWGSEGLPKPESKRRSKRGSNERDTTNNNKNNKKRMKEEGKKVKQLKKKGKCVFNNKKYKNNEIVEEVASRCFNLVCQARRRKRKGRIEVVSRTDCTCSDDGARSPRPHLVPPPAPGPAPPAPGPAPPAPPPARDCKEYKDTFTPFHSICLPKNKACGIHREGVNEEEKDLILKEHNDYRAKAWCSTCPTNHDCPDCRKAFSIGGFVGQNLYWNFAFQPDPVWSQALKAFYDEVELVPKTLVGKYLSIPTPKPIGHYTQMVWAETSEVGCGAAYHGPCAGSFPECKTYCCNYGPAGNILTRPIYEEGPAASNCPNGKSEKYEGLCKP